MKRAKKYHPNHPHIDGRNVVIGSDYDALAAKAERYIQEGISLADQRDALSAENQRLREALIAQAQAAPEAEPVEVVAWAGDGGTLYPTMKSVRKYLPVGRSAEPLMAVAQHNRIMASAPQHDAELVELLEAIAAVARGRESGYAARMHGDVVNGRCADSLVELLPRIDAKLATLSAKA